MKKFSIYCSFLLFSVHIMAQSSLPVPPFDSLNVPHFLQNNPSVGTVFRPVQSRNFVELQLDSILSTMFENGTPYTSARTLYTYRGDTTLLQNFSLSSTGELTGGYEQTSGYDAQNRVSYVEEVFLMAGGLPSTVRVSFYYYNPVYPTVYDSIRVYFKDENGVLSPNFFEDYNLVPGTSLTKSYQRETFMNSVVFHRFNVTCEYDAQQRKILQYNENINLPSGSVSLNRNITEYLSDTTVTRNETQLASGGWMPGFKSVWVLDPISTSHTQNWGYEWNGAAQDWQETIMINYTYDADNQLVLTQTRIYYENAPLYFTVVTDYVQEGYVDRITYYNDVDTTVTSALNALSQYYYSMTSTTTQPNAEKALVELAPNPAHTYLRARTEQNIQLAELYDLQGRLVMNIATEGTNVLHLHRNNLPGGTYVLRLQLENGATVSERVQWE